MERPDKNLPEQKKEITTIEELFEDHVKRLDAANKGRELATAEIANVLKQEGVVLDGESVIPPAFIIRLPYKFSTEELTQLKHKLGITDEEYAIAAKEYEEVWSQMDELPGVNKSEQKIIGFILMRRRLNLSSKLASDLYPGLYEPRPNAHILKDNKAIAKWDGLVYEFRKTHPEYPGSSFPDYVLYAPHSMQESIEVDQIRKLRNAGEAELKDKKQSDKSAT